MENYHGILSDDLLGQGGEMKFVEIKSTGNFIYQITIELFGNLTQDKRKSVVIYLSYWGIYT